MNELSMVQVKKPYIIILKDNIDHQNIGGKAFMIEREGIIGDIADTPWVDMTIAFYNFIHRRSDIKTLDKNTKYYYGHCIETNLGYYIIEDEIKEVR